MHVPRGRCQPFVKGANVIVNNNASPLEHLAAFAIVFVTAVMGTALVGKYIDRVREKAATR